ncbi:flavodoxin [Phytopseudomonas daroniae]|uniref:flavodoxin n=1 Tax=Phytopseudomonas daroniae TaxID=2487519 RepID=UPI0010383F5B|nr:flavodoxin [Pseudomonas daroniae]TBU78416.1 flavodoxin [Pseudomonas daroniae]
MSNTHDPLRRALIAALASAPFLGASNAGAQGTDVQRQGSRLLVAYFSRTGNTRVIAGLIQRALDTDLLEIQPAVPYPDDYLQTVEQARKERDAGYRPALASGAVDLAPYDTLLLGFPICGGSTPPVIRSFLSAHDLSGKTLIPFVTHGGYGLGDSRSVLVSHAKGARVLEGFTLEADQERRTMERVNRWLEDAKISG